MSEQTTTTTPRRPDIEALSGFEPTNEQVVCFNGIMCRDIVAWVKHLEQQRTMFMVFQADESEPPGDVIATFWDKAEADHFAHELWDGHGYLVVPVTVPGVNLS